MASITELLRQNTSDLNDRLRDRGLSYGGLLKAEKIATLADEDVPDELIDIMGRNKTDDDEESVVDAAEERGIEIGSKSKNDLLVEIAERELQGGGPTFPPSAEDSTERMPQEELSSHFDNAEVRKQRAADAMHQAVDKAMEHGCGYEVIESFRPKDASEPIKIQRTYSDRHPDTVVLATITPQTLHFPITTASSNPTYRPDAQQ